MKTRGFILSSMVLAGFVTFSCMQSPKKGEEATSEKELHIPDVSINTDSSKVVWSGTSLGVYTHLGTADFSSADLNVENGKITGGNFTVDLTTIVPTDENFNPEEGHTKEKLVGHLKSADFFDVENYPSASFTITEVHGDTLLGNLTIRGNTHEEKVTHIAVEEMGDKSKITGSMVFDRKKYDVSWDYGTKDMLLKKEIELDIKLVGTKK